MEREILHEFALDKNDHLIRAINAIKGEEYICPGCNGKFILRKSGNTGKGSRRPHFAHNGLEDNCSYETYLHNTFKIRVAELINGHISNGLPLYLNWKCNVCNQQHQINLSKIITKAKLEYNMKERTPDIALFNNQGNVVFVIEIVYKHAPEAGAIAFYQQHRIVMIQIDVFTEDDLNNIEDKLQNPTSVSLCIRPIITHQVRRPLYRNSSNAFQRDLIENPQNYYKKGNIWYRKRNSR
jgi:hypothetical protein